jgi:zinc/manganese transport system permease protein
VSVAGLSASFAWDLPTGAAVVTTFGALMAVVALGLGVRALIGAIRRKRWGALAAVGAVVAALGAAAGLLLALFPAMDHHWLNWLEEAAPGLERAFLTAGERRTYADTRADVTRQTAELERLRNIQQEVQWGTRRMSVEGEERLRQFLASRGEITAGDRMVLTTLRSHARSRQRYWLGLPLFLTGAATAIWLFRCRTRTRPGERG